MIRSLSQTRGTVRRNTNAKKSWALRFAMISAVLTSSIASANDASYAGDGATVYLEKDGRVAMDEEAIDVTFNPAKIDRRRWQARCKFTFRNLTQKPVTIQMGFPDWKNYSEEGDEWAITNFKARSRGADIKATHKLAKGKKPSGKFESGVGMPGKGVIGYEGAWTWTMEFKPNEVLVVENDFDFGGFTSLGPLSDFVDDKSSVYLLPSSQIFWDPKPTTKSGEDRDFGNSPFEVVKYIVTTGLTWAGPIGKARISITPAANLPHLIIPTPEGYSVNNGTYTWQFQNWRPKGEIVLWSISHVPLRDLEKSSPEAPLFDSLIQANKWISIARKNKMDKITVRQLWSAYYARRGLPISNPEAETFLKRLEFFQAPIKKSTLSPEEEKIVKALKAYEESL